MVSYEAEQPMGALIMLLRQTPLLWLLVFVPVVLVGHALDPGAHLRLFVFSVLAIVPLAALLSHATESVAARTGDTIGGLLNATFGNMTELVITLTALRAGEYLLVKASLAGVIVTNTLFLLGASFLLGGMKYHLQEFNRTTARLQTSLLFLATIALLVPSIVVDRAEARAPELGNSLSLVLAVMLIATYALAMLFSLKTHSEVFASRAHHEEGEPWPLAARAPHARRCDGARRADQRGVRRIGAGGGACAGHDARVCRVRHRPPRRRGG